LYYNLNYDEENTAYFGILCTNSEYSKMGLGKSMISRVENEAKENGCT